METKPMLRVGPHRIIAIRYVMKNSREEVLVNTMAEEPVTFLFGTGEILPGLEAPLKGLKIGEEKRFSLSADSPGLDQTLHFDVVIDDVRWAAEPGREAEKLPDETGGACGPDCSC